MSASWFASHSGRATAVWLVGALVSGCSMTFDESAPPQVPSLERPSDMLRVRYCATVEQSERAKAGRARSRDRVLFGTAAALGAVSLSSVWIGHGPNDNENREDALDAVAIGSFVVGLASLGVGLIGHATDAPKDHEVGAATAVDSAIKISALSDTKDSGAAANTATSIKLADDLLGRCVEADSQ